ncbi:MAG: nuclear transport factor 2 family protein [Sphingobacteriales bacterium]|nr:nuclear transport factor 2 family protein [Sphingobacteriales bacterium]
MFSTRSTLIILLFSLFFWGCNPVTSPAKERAIAEIAGTEKAFAGMAAGKGIEAAFYFFADSMAVIKRGNDSLIRGREGIRNFYSAPVYKTARVTWSPDFIEVSINGDLGYTYGKYEWISTDSSGKQTSSRGIFHTVWKKQSDGSWKYVWD